MSNLFIFVIFIVLGSLSTSRACSKTPAMRSIETHWEDVDLSRNVKDSCECGKKVKEGSHSWNLYVHVQKDSKVNTTCIATIITSNLIATSHQCFVMPGKYMNLYDLWRPRFADRNAVYDINQVIVSSTIDSVKGTTFSLEEIIYNPLYAIKSLLRTNPPEFDIVLLRVKADFTSPTSTLRPICFPSANDIQEMDELANIEASYYRSDEDLHDGVTMDEENDECEKMLGESYSIDKNLCFKYSGSSSNGVAGGGPLFVNSRDTSFLLGILSLVPAAASPNGVDYNLFTNLVPLIKYVEWNGDMYKSLWCRAPSALELKKVEKIQTDEGTTRDAWLWEMTQEPFKRSEVLDCDCGILNPSIGRIVGGVESDPYEFGWMTLLYFYEKRGHGESLCGGSIINDRMIMTAAHCVVNLEKVLEKKPPGYPPENIDVYVHVHSRKEDKEKQKKKVKTVIFHPGYVTARSARPSYYDYDIAIIIVEEPFTFATQSSRGLRPVCLPNTSMPYDNLANEIATVSGWGKTDPDDTSSTATKLQKIELPIARLSMCSNLAMSKVTERNICAGTLNRYKDAAEGDSGGPLMVLRNDRYVQYGIVSWGEDVETRSGETKTAALYSDVQKLVSFVDYHARKVKAKWCKSSSADTVQQVVVS